MYRCVPLPIEGGWFKKEEEIMELVYLYIKEGEPFKSGQHIQLSPLRTYKWINEDTIHCKERRTINLMTERFYNSPECFYNFNAIVGKNGVGKTELLKLLSLKESKSKYVLLYRLDSHTYLVASRNMSTSIAYHLYHVSERRDDGSFYLNKDPHPILNEQRHLMSCLMSDYENPTVRVTANAMLNEELISHMPQILVKESRMEVQSSDLLYDSLLSQLKGKKREMFKKEKYQIECRYDRSALEDIAYYYDEYDLSFFPFVVKENDTMTFEEKIQTRESIYEELYFPFLKEVVGWGDTDIFHAYFAQNLKAIYTNDKKLDSENQLSEKERIVVFFKTIKRKINESELLKSSPLELQHVLKFINSISQNNTWYHEYVEEFEKSYEIFKVYEDAIKKGYNYGVLSLDVTEENKTLVSHFLESHDYSFYSKNSWTNYKFQGLSEGEKHYLHLFSKINELILKNHKDNSIRAHYLFLIDEPDRYAHPELSRQLIHLLYHYLKDDQDIRRYALSIQVIVATHSPFIVTDFPSDHVLYLERDEEGTVIRPPAQQTFAANIHHLLMDDFFMEQTIGEFARKQLNDIMQRMQVIGERRNKNEDAAPLYEESYSQEEKDYIWAVIQAVGDPFVRHALHKKFESTFYSKDQQIDREIQELRERIERLQRKREERR